MITLIIIGYIIISLYFAWGAMQPEYVRGVGMKEGKTLKPALQEGFATPIIIVFFIAIVLLLACLAIKFLVWLGLGMIWIYQNMP